MIRTQLIIRAVFVASTLLAVLLAACSSESDPPATAGTGGAAGSAGSGGAPQTCEQDCDTQVAAGCKIPSTPKSCYQICEAVRKSVKEECRALFEDQYTCAAKGKYVCSAQGVATFTPQGLCASQASACATCNGGKLCLFQ